MEICKLRPWAKTDNPALMKVLEKTGLHKCDIFRKTCFKNGQFVDCHCYELLISKL